MPHAVCVKLVEDVGVILSLLTNWISSKLLLQTTSLVFVVCGFNKWGGVKFYFRQFCSEAEI